MKKSILLVVTILWGFFAAAQNKADILLEINGNPISTEEFKRVYYKNLDLVKEENQKSVAGYLDLFIDYKLKVAEARAQGFDTSKSYQKEISQYEDQLSRNYLFEDRVTEDLAKEAYERSKIEVDVSHILVMCGPDAKPKDTLAAYRKMVSIREKALKGMPFDSLAAQYSEEPNANNTLGRLGYFSVFDMIYPFETTAYDTPVNTISEIIRTQYGYHILKVHDKRERSPQIGVSHIMVSEKKVATEEEGESRINEIYQLALQGQSFESLAKQYSDDTGSAKNGGKLKPFTKGQLRSPKFEYFAYQLKTPGEISTPVKTDYGWHIIQLDSVYPIPTYEEEKEFFEKRVMEGSRSKVITYEVNKIIKNKFGFQKGDGSLEDIHELVTDSLLKRKWTYDMRQLKEDKVFFTLGKTSYRYSDFITYLLEAQMKLHRYKDKTLMVNEFYESFEDDMLKRHFRKDLEKSNKDYAALLNEYRDGLLIFEVMGAQVWNKAKNDSVGQEAYYRSHKDQYRWKDRVVAHLLSSTKKETLEKALDLWKKGDSIPQIKATLNTKDQVSLVVQSGTFEEGASELPKGYKPQNGVSEIFSQNNTFITVIGTQYLPSEAKTYEEVKGRVMGDYQNEVEKVWIQSLREKFEVKIHEKALKKIKKELGS